MLRAPGTIRTRPMDRPVYEEQRNTADLQPSPGVQSAPCSEQPAKNLGR